MERKSVQLHFSAAFDSVSHCGLLYKLRCIGVGGWFLSILLEFLSDKRQCLRLDGKISASVHVVLGVPYCSVVGPLLFI